MAVETTNQQSPAHLVARLTLNLHALIANGEGEGDAAEKIRDQMEVAWWSLSSEERARLTGLSEDLYTLAESPRFVAMTEEEKDRWGTDAKAAYLAIDTHGPDIALAFFRKRSLRGRLGPAYCSFRRGVGNGLGILTLPWCICSEQQLSTRPTYYTLCSSSRRPGVWRRRRSALSVSSTTPWQHRWKCTYLQARYSTKVASWARTKQDQP